MNGFVAGLVTFALRRLSRFLLIGGLGALAVGCFSVYVGTLLVRLAEPTIATVISAETQCIVIGRKGKTEVSEETVACDAVAGLPREAGVDYTTEEEPFVTLSYKTIDGTSYTSQTPAMFISPGLRAVGTVLPARYDRNNPEQVDVGGVRASLIAGAIGIVLGAMLLFGWWKLRQRLAPPGKAAAAASTAPVAAAPAAPVKKSAPLQTFVSARAALQVRQAPSANPNVAQDRMTRALRRG